MTVKYHINPKTGRPNLCGADPSNPKARGCPYKTKDGEPATHYNSKEEARTGYEKEQSTAGNSFSSLKKESSKIKKSNFTSTEIKPKELSLSEDLKALKEMPYPQVDVNINTEIAPNIAKFLTGFHKVSFDKIFDEKNYSGLSDYYDYETIDHPELENPDDYNRNSTIELRKESNEYITTKIMSNIISKGNGNDQWVKVEDFIRNNPEDFNSIKALVKKYKLNSLDNFEVEIHGGWYGQEIGKGIFSEEGRINYGKFYNDLQKQVWEQNHRK